MAEGDGSSIGAQLRTAREAQGLSLEDVAARTRIPTRHLTAIEKGDWDALPAPTYTVGFARSYANTVGINGTELGAELRALLNARENPKSIQAYYEPADPARVPPRVLVIVVVVIALLLVGGYAVWRSTAFNEPEGVEITDIGPAPQAMPNPAVTPAPAAPAAPASASGPVVLTATQEVWLRIYEAGGQRLFEGVMQPGQRFEVPATAQAPLILTGRPDALNVTVGTSQIPPLGPAQRTIADVSLAPRDLLARLGGGTEPAPAPAPGASPAAAPAAR